MKKNMTSDLETAFCRRYPQYAYLVRDLREALGKERVGWADLTRVNLSAFVDYLKSSHAPNSARTLCAVLKSFLNLWSEEADIPCKDFASVLRVRKSPSQQVALTEDEVMRLDAYVPKTQVEADIKTLAMREVFCGARGSDVELMTEANIVGGEVSYVAKKTKRSASIPAGSMLRKYMAAPVSKSYHRSVKNTVLKRICRDCGITQEVTLFYHGESRTAPKWQFVGFHTLRRTFASILASKGVPVTVIQHWMTHSTPMQTAAYIKVDLRAENKKYAGLFQ